MDETPKQRLIRQFRSQADWCARLGSSLYEGLLLKTADDVEREGPTWAVISELEGSPSSSAPALRFMGAVHRAVLEGRAPSLAAFYPSAGGSDGGDAWPAFVATVEAHRDELIASLSRPVQTNEVGRATALVCGFLVAARDTGLPLRVLEAGASAGLNLRWDHFLYEARGQKWGPEDSPVRLCDFNSENPLPFDVSASVIERAGCDINPLDVTTEDGRITLLSYVWADQVHRIRLLKGAMEIAARVPVTVEKAGAAAWIEERLHDLPEGVATVVYHSIFFQYLPDDEAAAFVEAIESAGRRASETAPLAWLRFEPGADQAETRLKMWPGGHDRSIATSSFHGAAVRFLG
jgi:hypothetical protein